MCLNAPEKRKNDFEMMSKSADFPFFSSACRLLYSTITIIVIMLSLSSLLSSCLSVSMIFQYVCLLKCAHNMGTTRTCIPVRLPRPTTRPPGQKCEFSTTSTTFGHYHFNYVPCHVLFEIYMVYNCVHEQKVCLVWC